MRQKEGRESRGHREIPTIELVELNKVATRCARFADGDTFGVIVRLAEHACHGITYVSCGSRGEVVLERLT